MSKCDHCGIKFDEEMTVNVCQGCGQVLCDECLITDIKDKTLTNPYNRCPTCECDTVPEDEIGEGDNIDQKIDDAKGYEG